MYFWRSTPRRRKFDWPIFSLAARPSNQPATELQQGMSTERPLFTSGSDAFVCSNCSASSSSSQQFGDLARAQSISPSGATDGGRFSLEKTR